MEIKECSKFDIDPNEKRSSFSAADICSIINACKDSGVSKLHIPDTLEIDFHSHSHGYIDGSPALVDRSLYTPQGASYSSGVRTNSSAEAEEVTEIEYSKEDQALLDALDDHQKMIDDPEGFEQLIRDEYLGRSDNTDD